MAPLRKAITVAKPFKPTRTFPLPPNSELVDIDGRPHVRMKERGKPVLYRISKDGTKYLRPLNRWYFECRDANGTIRRVKGYADLKATEQLVKEGFTVLVYTSDDPILARRLKEAGAASVMPAGSPIGSGQGILNPNNIRICLEYLKDGDPDYPVIVDAGVGTASDVSVAMELGCDGVLLNTAIASAKDPLRMAWAMRYATEAGRLAYLAGRIPKKLYANASSPWDGIIHPTV